MYVGPRRGIGQVVQVPLSDWGMVSPCGSSSGTMQTQGDICAPASSFPFFGTADGYGNCQPASVAMGVGVFVGVAVFLYAAFGGGR